MHDTYCSNTKVEACSYMGDKRSFEQILAIANDKDLAEVGGSHNQKGIEFQRHWAVMRMLELEEEGVSDFLILFEVVQDIAELDSSTSPTSIRIYQVKKREGRNWSWNDLTGLLDCASPSKQSARQRTQPFPKLADSPIGKLYRSTIAVTEIRSTGHFVSNAACNLPLAGGDTTANPRTCDLAGLSQAHAELLIEGFQRLHKDGAPLPDLSRIAIQRVDLSINDLGTHLAGIILKFLLKRCPKHAGQARSLADSLITKISPLGAKTDSCATFADMRRERGYSREEFINALADLETMPDYESILDSWLKQLHGEGMDIMDTTRIRASVTRIYRRQLISGNNAQEDLLTADCDRWLADHPLTPPLLPKFEEFYKETSVHRTGAKRSDILAQFALRAIGKCMDQSSED